jgi:hypothetical protein
MLKKLALSLFILCIFLAPLTKAQDQMIAVPKPLPGTPFLMDDKDSLFRKAWRFSRDGYSEWAADSLKKLIESSGFTLG